MMALVIIAALLALAYVAFNYFNVKKLEEGTDKMREIASAIRVGANAFISYEYKIITLVALIITVIVAILISWQSACAPLNTHSLDVSLRRGSFMDSKISRSS